ncbi:hypothetical protein Vretimale_7317 [Volvox reticuliferus]|uniref:Dihydroxyacetone kinase n=1 Tax=Volvox reticuliferus TaxID=1737510 RepID=A0A8J4G9B6_9CHLO|nr:hypothetical protein Vretifemale_19399 [Volvox reticuliferus]GIM02472.1 hypothetical protein Vretimale_7317 [Volvox reticuliferus]
MTTSKKLLNSPDTAVTDALRGLVLTFGHLQRLDGSPQIKVVINRNHDKSKVAVISGGGSGHEPAHAGYVGDGMLAAAVCGDIFASPSTEAVLAAIRAVTGPAGCLLVVKNYTGDRLNFGLAVEQALAEGLMVEMVVVGEDVAIECPSPIAGRRGLAGTVLVHKAAGAAAARGASLAEVAGIASRVAGAMATMGVGLTVCTLPGKSTSDRLGPDEVELGLGIHGEPGRTKESPPPPAGELVQRMLVQLTSGPFFRLKAEPRVILLVNNLGGTPPLELSVVTGEALTVLRRAYGAAVDRLFVGPYMTSLDMAGMSITLLSYDLEDEHHREGWDDLLELLDSPTVAPGWVGAGLGRVAVPGPYDPSSYDDIPAPLPLRDNEIEIPPPPEEEKEEEAPPPPPPPPQRRESSSSSSSSSSDDEEEPVPPSPPPPPPPPKLNPGEILGRCLLAAAESLLAAAPALDEMDAKVGDGDCGSTVASAASAIVRHLDAGEMALYAPATVALQLARCVRNAVGGSSGALYDILLTAAARQLKAGPTYDVSPKDWTEAFSAGLAAVQKYGCADIGCRTMLDALLPARDALIASLETGGDAAAAAAAAADAAEAGADATRGMSATAGRSSYVPAEVLAEVADPGATAAAVWLRAVARVLQPQDE